MPLKRTKSESISPQEVRELFNYHPDTGKLTWKVARQKIQKGSEAGNVDAVDGYMRTRIDGDLYYNHVLVWMHCTGKLVPEKDRDGNVIELDHMNRKRIDNRFENLQPLSKSDNQKNKNSF